MAWTDERLDDLSRRIDAGFHRVDSDIRELRSEMHAGFAAVRSEMREEIGSLRATLLRVGGGMMVGLLGVIAAILARGA